MKKIPQNLDMLMVLAGEDSRDKPRSKKAIEVYHEYGRLPLLLTGSHSGMNGVHLPKGVKPLSHQMRDYILKNDVKDGDIIIEDKSMDTIANFYFSLLEGLTRNCENVGIDTDQFHMRRSLYFANLTKKVLGEISEFVAVPSDYKGSLGQKIQESILTIALKHDLSAFTDGDFDFIALRDYMHYRHPFHAIAYGNTPKPSWYSFLIERAKKSGVNLRAQEKEELFKG